MKKKLQGVLRLTLPPKQISSNWRNTFYAIMSIMVLLFSNTINAQTVETFTTPTATSLGAPFAEATTYKIQDYIYAPDSGDATKTYLYRVTGAGPTTNPTSANGTGTGTSGTQAAFNLRAAGTGNITSGDVVFSYAGTWANFAASTAYALNAVINVVDTGNSQLNYSYKVTVAGTSGTLVDFNARAAGSGDITSGTVVFQYVSPINPIMAATQSWTCPAGIFSIDVQAYGGGGGGGAIPNTMPLTNNKYYASGGGGAGSKVTKTITVVPGTTYNVIVGLGGLRGATSAAAGYYGYPGGKSGFTGPGISDLIASGGTGGTGAGAVNPQGNPGGSLGGVYGYQVFSTATTSYLNGSGSVTLRLGGVATTDAMGVAYATGTIKNVSYIAPKVQGTGFTVAPTVTVKDGAGQTFASYINKDINSTGAGIVTTRGANGGNGTTATTEVAAVAGAGASNVDGLAGGLAGANLVSATTAKGGGNAPYNSYGAGGGGAFLFCTNNTGNSTSSASGGFGAQGKVVITYAAATATSETVTYCGAYSPAGSGQTYTESGIYTYNIGNNTVTLTLTVNPAPTEPTKVNCYDTYTLSQETCTWVNNNVVGPNAGTDGLTTVCAGNTPTTQKLNDAITGEEEGGVWTNVGLEYTYTVTATCGATDTATVTVTEQALPNAGTDTTLTVCTGTTPSESDLSAALTGEDAGGTWTNDGLVHTYTVNATAPCTGSDTATVTVTIQAAANAGTDTTLSLFAAPSNADLLAALTGADANGTWSHPAVGFVGVHTYTVVATSPCTQDDSATVTVTASTLLPTEGTTLDFCKGAKVSALTAEYGSTVKAYAARTGGLVLGDVALTGTTELPKAYYLSEPAIGGGESARILVNVRVNLLPATPSLLVLTNDNAVLPLMSTTAVTAVGVYAGTNTPFKLTATAGTPTATTTAGISYVWTLPSGVVRTNSTGTTTDSDATSTDAFIYVKFTVTGVATPLVIGVQSVNAAGCTSAVKSSASLTRLLPAAPAAIKMTDASLPLPISGIAAAVTSFAKYMGTDTILTLTATPSLTATSYSWELPTGVTQLSGGNTNVITVNFLGVTKNNTFNYTTTASVPVSTNVLRIGVKSVNGVGVSFTSNTSATFPETSSTAKLLTLKAVAPAAPSAIKMTNNAVSTTTAVTAVSTFIGTTTTFTLTATPSVLASSYTWELPAGVNLVSGDLTGSSSNVITVNFNNVPAATTAIAIGVKGVNGIGSSVTVNTAPNAASTAKLLKLTAAIPAVVSAVAGQVAGVCGSSSYSYTITPSPLATSYVITAPAGSVVTSASNLGNTTETLTTTDLTFTVTYPAAFVATVGAPKSLAVAARNGVGASANKTLTLSTLMPAIATVAGGITFQRTTPQVFSASVLGATTYTWVAANGAVITNGQGTNSVTVDFSAVSSAVLSTKLTVSATNACGVSTAIKSVTLASTTSGARIRQEAITGDFNVIAYPNPSSDVFTLEVQSSGKGKATTEVQVYDMIGRLIEQRQVESNSVEVGNNYPSGVYNVIVNQGENTKSLRVIKK